MDTSVIIYLLKKIDEDETIDKQTIENQSHPLIKTVIYLADEHLAGADDFKHNISLIKQAGFDVYAGEQDRFGWLSGCIQLKKGTIVFG